MHILVTVRRGNILQDGRRRVSLRLLGRRPGMSRGLRRHVPSLPGVRGLFAVQCGEILHHGGRRLPSGMPAWQDVSGSLRRILQAGCRVHDLVLSAPKQRSASLQTQTLVCVDCRRYAGRLTDQHDHAAQKSLRIVQLTT